MAVNHIIYNAQLPHAQRLKAFINTLGFVREEGTEILAIMAQMKDSGTVGQYLADKYGFGLLPGTSPTTSGDVTTAQAAVAELESVMAKLNCTGNSTTDHVLDAIEQVVAKFG